MRTHQGSVPRPPELAGADPVQAGRSSAGRISLGSVLGALVILSACTAPGMKLNTKPGRAEETTTQMDGLNVTLRPLSHEVLKAKGTITPPPTDPILLLTEKIPPYRIGPHDVVLVTIWDHPELTLPLGQFRTDLASGILVDDEGLIYFPHVGKFKVAGLTASQVRDTLTSRLSKVLQNPQIDVKVTAYRSQKIYIGGEVKNPAVYHVTDTPFTLAEAIHQAGGFLPSADDSRLLLTRGEKIWQLNFYAMMTSSNLIGQILLKDGDTLHVPNRLDAPVYMMGELMKPGNLPLIHGNLSLAQAISEAGGIQGVSADARSIYVIRQGKNPSSVDVFHLDSRNPTAMVLADRFQLNPRDLVYVDAGTLVRFSRVMNLILPTVSAVIQSGLAVSQYNTARVTVR